VLVLVSFVLVLAAAVTLVVGLLQSGLTLIYLSIGCSVLAGIVLAVAVLRGRPEPRAAAPVGRPYTPPVSAPPVPASVGAPTGTQRVDAPTTSFTPPPPSPPPPNPTPRPTPSPAPVAASNDAATKAAGTALLGRLRGRRTEDAVVVDAAPEPVGAQIPEYDNEPATMSMSAVDVSAADVDDDDSFPIADYDQLRATDLLRRLSDLDRNQLEAVRDRETAGKNRFTILSRVDTLLEAQSEPAWEVDDDEWDDDDDDGQAVADARTSVIEMGPIDDDDDDLDDDEDDAFAVGEMEDDEADEVDELVSPADGFPIAGYDSLTVGQILPRLSDLDADGLAQVRAREQQGRARGTILDRVDRLAAKSAPMAMPSAPRRAPARVAPARKAAPRTAGARTTPVASSPMKEAVKKAAAARKKTLPPPVAALAPRKAATRTASRTAGARKMPAVPVLPAASTTPMQEAVKKAGGRKKAAPVVAPAPAPRKATGRKAAAPILPETTDASPMKAAVKKARAAKATKRL